MEHVTTGVSQWFGRAQPPASAVRPIRHSGRSGSRPKLGGLCPFEPTSLRTSSHFGARVMQQATLAVEHPEYIA